jgi:hypothetical protein
MNKYKYKELDYALKILGNGFISKFAGTELRLLAKYYKYINKLDNDDIKMKLHDFCREYLNGYNKAIHYKIINNAVNSLNNPKNKLIQIDSIPINKNELAYIDSLHIEHNFKRVIFTLLVINKLSKEFLFLRDGEIKNQEYYFGGHKNFRELNSLAKITFSKKKKSTIKNIHDLIHVLDEKGIVEITNNGNIKLSFMYEITPSDEVVFTVDDFQTIGFNYDYYHGENKVKECDECGTLIKVLGKYKLYCDDCSIVVNRAKTLEKYHKNKNFEV